MSLMWTWDYVTEADEVANTIAKLHAIGLDEEGERIARYVQTLEQEVADAAKVIASLLAKDRRWKYACCAIIVVFLSTIAFVNTGTMA